MAIFVAVLSGVLFGVGLTVSGMNNPQKILNFLDVAAVSNGAWDPTMLMVFVGALPVMFLAYQCRQGMTTTWLKTAFSVPDDEDVDAGLLTGSTMFGVGWGLIGLCPGPAVVAMALASREVIGQALLFFGAMLCGVWLAYVLGLSGSHKSQIAV
jgi:uncharacterized membrane protein YedE/YeeE